MLSLWMAPQQVHMRMSAACENFILIPECRGFFFSLNYDFISCKTFKLISFRILSNGSPPPRIQWIKSEKSKNFEIQVQKFKNGACLRDCTTFVDWVSQPNSQLINIQNDADVIKLIMYRDHVWPMNCKRCYNQYMLHKRISEQSVSHLIHFHRHVSVMWILFIINNRSWSASQSVGWLELRLL